MLIYDEAGNRVRKQTLRSSTNGGGGTDGGDSWVSYSDEFYVRGINGKEIAIYDNANIDQWNIWGLDNVGKVNSDRSRYYYIKDHLGSIRVILDTNGSVVSAQDYDAWGYMLDGRDYDAMGMRYAFTGKERDRELETQYDYFGARYYNSRIGNWTSVDPLFEKHIGWTPYNYVLRNPLLLIDPKGEQVKFSDNVAIRSLQTSDVAKMLSGNEYSNYIKPCVDDNGNYILDVYVLASADKIMGPHPEDFVSLRKLANGSEMIELRYINERTNISVWVFGEENVQTGKFLSKANPGLTVVSGKPYNPENPDYISRSGNTEIYNSTSQSEKERVTTLAHEIYGHAEKYIKGENWTHRSVGKDVYEKIEARAARNFDNH